MAKFVVSPTARRGHRSISSALLAANTSGRAAVVEVEPGHYREQLTIRGQVEVVARGAVVVDWPHGRVVDAIGAVRLAGLVLVGRDGDAVDCGGGTLTIETTRIQAGGGVALHARPGSSVTLRDSAVDHGRVVFAGAIGLVERCRFTAAADNAIAVIEGADARIEGSRFDGASIHGVRVSGARARITDCDLTGTGQAAVIADSQAEIVVENCRITAVHGPGISITEQSRGTVEGTRVSDAEHGIVVAGGADPLVRRCVFTDCRGTGINVHQNGRGRFEDVEVVDSGDVAVYSTTGGAPDVRGCRISGGNAGIVVQDGRGTFTGVDVEDLNNAGLRLLGSATATFSRITVSRCPSGLESNGGSKAKLTDVAFHDIGLAAVTVLGTSRITLDTSSATRAKVGFGVGEDAYLVVRDCRADEVELGGAVAFDSGRLTLLSLTVTGPCDFGVHGRDSAYLSIEDCDFTGTTVAGVSLDGSCGGTLARCSVTGTAGVAVLDNGKLHLTDLRSTLPVVEHTPEPAPPVPRVTINNDNRVVFNAAVVGSQIAWNNESVVQNRTGPP
ncbi:MAG: right-handed parallel beta-helix repeat-containing protein [Umezawaea sp.]